MGKIADSQVKLLGVLLCYNDGDLLKESIEYLLSAGHELIVWNHGSDDETASVIDTFCGQLLETKFVPREFDFYQLYPEMSRNIMQNYAHRFDWVSWPDQDEFLEGPTRAKSYKDALQEVFESPYNWIRFNNFNYWFTDRDDVQVPNTTKRVRHYCLFPDCAPRIRSWRASATNIREFNHNPPLGDQWPVIFNLRHYACRSRDQMARRILKDRAGLRRGDANYHYDNMKEILGQFEIKAENLHLDDGISDLDHSPKFNWRTIYGHAPSR